MKYKITLVAALLSAFGCSAGAQEKPKTTEPAKPEISRSRTEPIKVGAVAPDFTLTDENGKAITLSAVKQPVVLVFYRGYW